MIRRAPSATLFSFLMIRRPRGSPLFTYTARRRSGVSSVACASAGTCAAGGYYADGSGHLQAFVAIQRNGRWGTAIEVPGTAALNAGGEAQVNSVSCNQPGPCTAGGFYKRPHGPNQGVVVSWS